MFKPIPAIEARTHPRDEQTIIKMNLTRDRITPFQETPAPGQVFPMTQKFAVRQENLDQNRHIDCNIWPVKSKGRNTINEDLLSSSDFFSRSTETIPEPLDFAAGSGGGSFESSFQAFGCLVSRHGRLFVKSVCESDVDVGISQVISMRGNRSVVQEKLLRDWPRAGQFANPWPIPWPVPCPSIIEV
jgi:hypothetical protein